MFFFITAGLAVITFPGGGCYPVIKVIYNEYFFFILYIRDARKSQPLFPTTSPINNKFFIIAFQY